MSEQFFINKMIESVMAVVKPIHEQSAEEASKAVYAALSPLIESYGQNPEIESFVRQYQVYSERTNKSYIVEDAWRFSWEAGPFSWAYEVSMAICAVRLCEPHYSFDLVFYDKE